jgi:hypothetical protein
MLCEGVGWTLVRYAGPASKASIGSKPIGSELEGDIGLKSVTVNEDPAPAPLCQVRGGFLDLPKPAL